MNCYGCKKKVDPILTFARPHGKYSKCEECRKKAREAKRARTHCLHGHRWSWTQDQHRCQLRICLACVNAAGQNLVVFSDCSFSDR